MAKSPPKAAGADAASEASRTKPGVPKPSDQQRFTDFLRNRGYKSTPERQAIVDQVIASQEHFTVDDLYDELRRHGDRRVSRATIYRTLELLTESGLVNKIDWIGSTTHYEIAMVDEHHDHFICTHCGQIYEFFSPTLEAVQDRVCTALGLTADDHTLKIEGVPNHCREQLAKGKATKSPAKGSCPFGFRFEASRAEGV